MEMKRMSEEEEDTEDAKRAKICHMLRMPNEVLAHLYKFLHPGSPENFSLCCKRLRAVYEENEHEMQLPVAFHRNNLVIRPHDQDVGVEFEVYRHNQENVLYKSLENPPLIRIKRLLGHTEHLEVEPVFQYPPFLQKNSDLYKKMKDHLKTCNIGRATIRGMDHMRGSGDFIALFEKKPRITIITRAELLEPEKEGVIGKAERLEIFSPMSDTLIKEFLADNKITNFSSVPLAYVPVEPYVKEWREGKREIVSYEFRYVNMVIHEVAGQFFERNIPGARIQKLELRTSIIRSNANNLFFIELVESQPLRPRVVLPRRHRPPIE